MAPTEDVDLWEFEEEEELRQRPNGCWFARLTEEQQRKVNEARARGKTFPLIKDTMAKYWGVHITVTPISRHFAGGCRCPRD